LLGVGYRGNHSGKTGGDEGLPMTQSLLQEFGVSTLSIPKRTSTIIEIFRATVARLVSYAGWFITDKTADKV
jgi:hypothetical protein